MYVKSRQVKYPLGLYVAGRLILVTDPVMSAGVPLTGATQPVVDVLASQVPLGAKYAPVQ